MAPDVPDISEDLLLGRTLLEQGHLSTAQRVLVKLCQQHPGNSEAFRGLGDVLHRKGDETRSRIIAEYAADLGVHDAKTPRPTPLPETRPAQAGARQGPTAQASARKPPASRSEFVTPLVDPFTPPVDSVTPRPTPPTPSVGSVTPRPNLVTPPVVVSPALTMPSSSHPVALPSGLATAAPASAKPGAKLGKYVAVAAVLLAGLGILGYRAYKPVQRRGPWLHHQLDSALSSGSFERLTRVRDQVRSALAGAEPDADTLVRLALVEAFLALDHGVPGAKNAEEDLRRLRPGDRPNPQRLALVEAVRALLALAAGDREMAREHVDVGLAWGATRPPAALLLASARVRAWAGDNAGAGKDLDSALQGAPDFAAVVADWSAQRLDSGDAGAARRVAREFLAKNKTAWRVQLALADAERALGERGWIKHVESACRGDNRVSRAMRAACSLAAAQEVRLDGERSSATRKARAAGQSSDDLRVLADSALVLASLGEIDAADEVLARARKLADAKAIPLAWADLAIRLGRGQVDGATSPAERPAQPERQLVALRAVYLKGGGAALAAAINNVPAGASEIDPDLRTFMELGHEGGASSGDRAVLERRAEHGSPVAAFALGVLSAREGDHKQAAKWLEKALAGHGDACRAALLYLSALQAQDRPAAPNRASLRALRARNAQCPIPEM